MSMRKSVLLGVASAFGIVAWSYALSWCLGFISAANDAQVAVGYVGVVALAATAIMVLFSFGSYLCRVLKTTFPALALLVLALGTIGCGTTIQPGHAGIVVNSYGKNRGVQDYAVSTGRVWYNPWTTDVFEWPVFVQSVVWTHNTQEGNPINEEITFTNKDQMQIAADVSMAYHLDIAKLPAFYVKFRTSDMTTFTNGYLRSLARDKFNDIAGRYTIAQIMGDNGPFLKEVRDALQKDLEPFGVMLESQFGFIGAPRPPNTVVEAINQQAVAQRLSLTKENELRQVQADAAKQVAQAEGAARSAVAASKGEAEAERIKADADAYYNRTLSSSLTPLLVNNRTIEKWDGKLPEVSGGATPFINLSSRSQEK